ncbi:hypothetical protein K439DRAFT_1658511 [Ramaria rubella]|nr:hypothetical protein K439DRAFT_1658511 [Ramaria rubella]
MLTSTHLVALSIFASYFLLIFFLFYTIISSIRRHAIPAAEAQRALLFCGLTLASFAHTWYWMFRFLFSSFHSFEALHVPTGTHDEPLLRVANWLAASGLFEEAWSAVCTGPLNWWWSEQLCLFTAGAFTVFLFMQRERVPHAWAYMLLGQVVAISVAWSLLNLALVIIPPKAGARAGRAVTGLPLSLTAPVLLSLLTVSLSPYTSATTFLPNLLAMHALLMVPLLPFPPLTLPALSPRPTSFYTLVALLSTLLRTRTTLAVLSSLHITSSPFFSLQHPMDVVVALWNAPGVVYGAAWETLHGHAAQASIGWDVVWTSVVWLAWGLCGEGRWTVREGVVKVFPTAVASVGVIAPMEFGRVLRGGLESKRE